jgi:sulfate transport system permease protein
VLLVFAMLQRYIVAGLTLLALYGPKSPFGLNLAYSQGGILIALLFVTLPFVVRSVQPVLLELDRDMEEAAASLGANDRTVLRRIILPNLVPAILTGCALSFARSIGEFGSVVLISGNLPFKTEVAAQHLATENDGPRCAALRGAAGRLLAMPSTSCDVVAWHEDRHDRRARPPAVRPGVGIVARRRV